MHAAVPTVFGESHRCARALSDVHAVDEPGAATRKEGVGFDDGDEEPAPWPERRTGCARCRVAQQVVEVNSPRRAGGRRPCAR